MPGKTLSIVFSLLLLVLVGCTKKMDLTPEQPLPHGVVDSVAITDTVKDNRIDRDALLKLVNGVRSRGCNCGGQQMAPVGPVNWNGLLEKAAYAHSKDMTDNHYFNHTGLNGSTPGGRLDAVGYNWSFYGENIANGSMDEQAVILGWLHSPDHCRNIMNGNFVEIGVGRNGLNWTMELGSRRASAN
ncbi:CAP domain-containing protein [Chitinophaga silvatica]|nr:CAP domain-containing protein [Chitinophaga silvatica]